MIFSPAERKKKVVLVVVVVEEVANSTLNKNPNLKKKPISI
jgi:hypothetical protein